MTDPTTIPAIAPPDRPSFWPIPPVGEGVVVAVCDGNSGGIEDVGGNLIPSHRVVTFEATQHESVAFGELAAHSEQRP